ncbi:olfactory receptor 142 isoform X2 [Monodelphis domestica]|uniref:Olfactory receptor n=1 Tax=Monodelphis domestica TaxID=13616 RepID=A0A5F8HD68_MONDO|nr:olfactory receptor 142 isoform X2 [Monodelphis domestica]
MAITNNVTQLIFMGLFQDREAQRVSFIVFLPMYMATMLGNGLIILTVNTSKSLSSPMYFFLSHLSLVEICYSSTIVPKFISGLLTENKTISLDGCMTQIFFFHFFGVAEILLLTVMAYDRYVAICKPLHYMTIMNRPVCHMLVFSSWVGAGFLLKFAQRTASFGGLTPWIDVWSDGEMRIEGSEERADENGFPHYSLPESLNYLKETQWKSPLVEGLSPCGHAGREVSSTRRGMWDLNPDMHCFGELKSLPVLSS